MRNHADEVALAQAYSRARPFDALDPEQMARVRAHGQALYRWFKTHQRAHHLISAGVIAFLLGSDLVILLWLPGAFLDPEHDTTGRLLVTCAIIATLHGWMLYSLTIYSLHEGAAHESIFPPRGPITHALCRAAGNLCRLSGADPVEYRSSHRSHHARFGTTDDAEFLNFVHPRRFWRALVPYAMFVNFSDFIAHRPLSYTRSRLASELVTLSYHGLLGYFMAQRFGLLLPVLSLAVLAPHVAFHLDRLRQFSEHNLMPVASKDGARSFGTGFWGLFVGGGPWGQPCHWMHHLVPSVPWYQQIILHHRVAGMLSPRQRAQFLLAPGLGYPRLLWRLWTETRAFARSSPDRDGGRP